MVAQASEASGIPPSPLSSQKKTGKLITRRSTRYFYDVHWTDPKIHNLYLDCSKGLTSYDRASFFHVRDDEEFAECFHTLYAASQENKIHYNAFENAAINGNPSITRRPNQGSSLTIGACSASSGIRGEGAVKLLSRKARTQGVPLNLLKMDLNDLERVMELMLASMTGIEHRIWAIACIVAYQGNVSPDYIVSRDHFISLLGMTDEMECLRCSRVMQIHAILHDAYSKLKSKYGIGPRYCYALPSCSRFSSPYLGHITGLPLELSKVAENIKSL